MKLYVVRVHIWREAPESTRVGVKICAIIKQGWAVYIISWQNQGNHAISDEKFPTVPYYTQKNKIYKIPEFNF